MREVYVIGVGSTRYGQLLDWGVREMAEDAAYEALKDAGAAPGDIQVAYCGTQGMACADTTMLHGQIALEQIGITGIPITNIKNACGSGSNAFREAWLALQSGLYDVALAIGFEKMCAPLIGQAEVLFGAGGGDTVMEGSMGFFPPGSFAMAARFHMEKYGTTREQIARVAVKNRRYGSLNPKAHFRKEITVEDVLKSRTIAEPLNMYDCCPISDGCAVAILAGAESAGRFPGEPVAVAASAHVSGTYAEQVELNADTTRRAARAAYEMAGLGPEDMDFAEVHDCFSYAEIKHYEDLGFCAEGDGGRMIEEGEVEIDGRIPVNISGGLIAKGHPLGATGIGQIGEVVTQIRGRAGRRQIAKARVGLTHNGGGFRHADTGIVAVHILKKV